MDEATRPGGRSLLQPASGSDFNIPSSRHWASRVAVPTRGTETKGHLIAAPGTCVRLERDDLAGLVGAFPRATAGEALPNYRLAIEFLGVGIIALTGHLGGFLSGVNGPG